MFHTCSKYFSLPLLVLSLLVILQGCSSVKPTGSANANPKTDAKAERNDKETKQYEAKRLEFEKFFFEGQKEKIKGNFMKAMGYFELAHRTDPDNSTALYELATMYFNQSKFPQAETYIAKAIRISPNNEWFRLLLADIYQNQNKFESAAKVYQDLILINPESYDYYQSLVQLQQAMGDNNGVVKTYQKMEAKFGILEEMIVAKQKFFYSTGQYLQAEKEINKLLDENPNSIEYLRLLAQTYLKAGMDAQAKSTFERIQAIDSTDEYTQLAQTEYYFKKKDSVNAFIYLQKAFSNAKLPIESKLQIIGQFFATNGKIDSANSVKTERLAVLLSQVHSTDARAFAVLGEIYQQLKKPYKAREAFRKAIELKKSDFVMWQQLLFIESELKDNTALEEESKKAMEYFPNQPLLYFFNGLAKTELKMYNEAIDILKTGLGLVYNNNPLEVQFYTNLAEAYYRANRITESFENFEKAVSLDPKNTLALNNYAYYLSLRKERLERAEEMSKKTVELEPSNPSYQDTYGWVLFQLGKYEEAEKWLYRAVFNEPNSPEVLEHYGDCLFQLGRVDEAVAYWQKAKVAGSDNKNLSDKIAQRKL